MPGTATARRQWAALSPLLCVLLAACVSSEPRSGATPRQQPAATRPQQLDFALASGNYQCELGQSLAIAREARDLIELTWLGKRHKLQRINSTSGLPRYEDRQNALLWIDLPWKGMLMDLANGRPLANECKPASRTTSS